MPECSIGCKHYKKENILSNYNTTFLNYTNRQNTLPYSPCFCSGMTQPDKENISSADKNTFDVFTNRPEDEKHEIESKNSNQDKETPESLKPFYSSIWNNETAKQAFLLAVSPIIFLRRIMSVPDKIKNGDYLGALGMIVTMGILSTEDFNDMKATVKQITGKLDMNSYYKSYQKSFSFVRNSLIQPLVNKMGKWGYYVHEFDHSLYETRFGQKIKNWFSVEEGDKIVSEDKIPRISKDFTTGEYIKDTYKPVLIKLEGGSKIGRLVCQTNQRITIIGAGLLYLFTIPSIIKAFNRGENTGDKFTNGSKQALKSTIGVTTSVLSIGLVGALMAPLGPAGAVAGMGLGAFIGYNLADMINRNIKTK